MQPRMMRECQTRQSYLRAVQSQSTCLQQFQSLKARFSRKTILEQARSSSFLTSLEAVSSVGIRMPESCTWVKMNWNNLISTKKRLLIS